VERTPQRGGCATSSRGPEGLADHATARLAGREDGIESTLRSDARAIDAAYQAVLATAQPVGRTIWGSTDVDTMRALRLTSASRNYSRNLVVDTGRLQPPRVSTHLDMGRASATLHHSIEVVARALAGPRDSTYTRSSSLFDQAERGLDACPHRSASIEFALRDFKLLDGTMARMAELIGLGIAEGYDTEMRTRVDLEGDQRRASPASEGCEAELVALEREHGNG
jgi:hypothetical protein